MRHELTLKIQPKLLITPQLKLSLEILTASILEVKDIIERELEENPFLLENEEYTPIPNTFAENDEEPWWERAIAEGKTLLESLKEQIEALPHYSPEEKKLMQELVNFMDEKGYLQQKDEDLAKILGTMPGEVEKLRIAVATRLEPIGCCSKNFEEFLSIQLKEMEVNENLIKDIESLKKLPIKPYPLWGYSEEPTFYIKPDAYVVEVSGEFQVYVEERFIPKLILKEEYKNILKDPNISPEVKKFLKEKLKKAVLLLKAVEQRNKTLRKIVEAVVELERDFFTKGPKHLKPLTLKEVAETTHFHISTVSRTINRKYIHTPYGTYPLRYFFERKGYDIKQKIKELIEAEDKNRPLSDQEIADLLKKEGINIARRTVAKYREDLGIPASSKRRKRRDTCK